MEMRLPVARKPLSEALGRDTKKHLVVPGDTITTDTGFMRYVGIWGARGLKERLGALHVGKPRPLVPLRVESPRDLAHLLSIPLAGCLVGPVSCGFVLAPNPPNFCRLYFVYCAVRLNLGAEYRGSLGRPGWP